MTDEQQRIATQEFSAFWKGKEYEKGEGQQLWINLLRDIYGVEKPQKFIIFLRIKCLDHTSFLMAPLRQRA